MSIELGYDELIYRLKRLDEDANLELDDENVYSCVIVGGGALILLGYRVKATHDIDIINHSLPHPLQKLMEKYDMSTNVLAYNDCFPDDYISRAKELNINTTKIIFYVLSLEDLVISKLAAYRDKDLRDITSEAVLQNINWDTLEILAEEIKPFLLNERILGEFEYSYNEYVRRYRK